MKILLDTSIIVDIDRNNTSVVSLLKKIVEKGDEFVISTVTVAEILTGSYLRRDAKEAVQKAKEVLNQCQWKNVDGETAEKIAQLYSLLLVEKKEQQIEYPDVIIAATFFTSHCDILLTRNKKDFVLFPILKEKVFTPEEFVQYLKLK